MSGIGKGGCVPRYTYGKGVKGRATVVAEYPWRYYGDEDYRPISHIVALDDSGEVRAVLSNVKGQGGRRGHPNRLVHNKLRQSQKLITAHHYDFDTFSLT